MELWGGHECTVNRVGERYRDQTRLTGHQDRIEDLARFAALGIRKLRYPVLWERVAPDQAGECDWRWSDERLAEIGRLGMAPIVGLLHHGSGPRHTGLIADNFVAGLTAHAAAVAERYPHVLDWTPVNEPLTTARFSALYGVWYPHARDERLFWHALLNQVEATCGAMRAIRRVNPAARLIQTEDLGQYYATAELAGPAEHLNHRRWMSWDLLTGRVVPGHALWDHLERFGFGDRLRALADDPCPPDIIGVNYYPTSERFIDHRLDRYPLDPPEVGYHDLTALRVLDPPTDGLRGMLRQAWARYGLPLAVTESHLGCTREEQLRWLHQSWQSCLALAAEGVDVRALTAWALLGNVDWDSLITIEAGHYEPGAFDISGGEPRPTALAALLAAIGTGSEPPAPIGAVASGQGWWQRPVRLEHPPFAWAEASAEEARAQRGAPILITGATGTLGNAIAGACTLRGLDHVLTDRATLPITDPERVGAYLDEHRPWAVINAAGWVRVDDAECDREGCFAANHQGAIVLAEQCARRGIRCTLFSSDLVFDGEADGPYVESDHPGALGVYGASKAAMEAAAAATCPNTLVIRTAAFFSPYDPHNFAMAVERTLRDGHVFTASADHRVTPSYVPDLVSATLDLVLDGEGGLWHLSNETAVSWSEFACLVADALELDRTLIEPAGAAQLGWRARRPRNAALRSERGKLLPPLAHALARHAAVRGGRR